MTETPLQTWNYPIQVYADPATTMGGGTPLLLSVRKGGGVDADHVVVVKLRLLQTYEAMIFQLQQEVFRYKLLLDQLLPATSISEELRLTPEALNPAFATMLPSLLSPDANAQMRGYLEQEDE